ncbi:hypothetical protein ZYGM_004188 [Zygosaccharomyces mellis]|uniref:RING-type domain-containing protein n=1 Tax=Zygosaccharomyces mellis TaxID=42258 RepID=A0A4C2DZ77_9SACH|nr:hypothetical protein ZYGM_004188 [Zygosaccharomyces mellis]
MNRLSSEADTTDGGPNKRRRLSDDSHYKSESESETDVSFEVVGERDAFEDAPSEEVDLMKVLNEVDDEAQGEGKKEKITETIDLEDEAAEQQVRDVPQEENEAQTPPKPPENKAVREYHCPICFDPPDTAVMTPCGHIFCVACLFQMVNSSRTHRKSGNCALCRSEVKLRDIRLVILRKQRVKKS